MNWKKLVHTAGRGVAVVQIAGQLATVPITKDGTPDLVKQYANLSGHARVQDIRRQIAKDTTKSYLPTTALDKRTAKRLRKG